jgi:hypothetical protein
MESHFEARVTGSMKTKSPLKLNIPAANADTLGLVRGDIVKVTLEKVEK